MTTVKGRQTDARCVGCRTASRVSPLIVCPRWVSARSADVRRRLCLRGARQAHRSSSGTLHAGPVRTIGPGAARPWRRAGGGRPRRRRSRAGRRRGAAAATAAPDRLVRFTKSRRRARTRARPASDGSQVSGPSPRLGLGAADAQGRPVEAEHRVRVGSLGLDGQAGPVAGLGQPRLRASAPAGLNPNGGAVPPTAAARGSRRARVGAAGPEVHRVLDLGRPAGPRPRPGPARRPGRCRASRAAPPRAARPPAPAAARVAGPSATPWRLRRERERRVRRGRSRVTGRVTSWLERTQVGGRPDRRVGRERGVDRRAQARRRPTAGPGSRN